MSALAVSSGERAVAIEAALIQGDLSRLSPEDRTNYYLRVCESLGLNPLTKPFEYLSLNGRTILYAKRDCTDQLRARDRVNVTIRAREIIDGICVVTARATTPDGREDESTGAVNIEGLKGDNRANAMMKAETKAKRRVTLSICGLGMLDENEVETIPNAIPQPRQLESRVVCPIEAGRERLNAAKTLPELAAAWRTLSYYQQEQLAEDKNRRKAELSVPPTTTAPPPPASDPADPDADPFAATPTSAKGA